MAPIRAPLMVGWVAVLFALAAAALLVRGVMRLSERRATFVSSVTHELRTPLTTFRLYSDLLAEGMVREEEKRGDYLRTMRSEADRLHHLVENVLAYSRIERGSARTRREQVALGDLLDRMRDRLAERVRPGRDGVRPRLRRRLPRGAAGDRRHGGRADHLQPGGQRLQVRPRVSMAGRSG